MAKKSTTTKSTPGFDAPQSRNEAILQNILGADNVLGEPQSRIEALLMAILEQGGGGGGGTADFPDAMCRNAFVEIMQRKADKLGLDMTVHGPAGFSDDGTDNQLATANAMVKMFTIASGYDELCKMWNTSANKYIYSKGADNTRHLLHSSVYGHDDGEHYADSLTDYYDMLGGKTGTWAPYRMLGAVIQGDGDTVLVGFVRRNGNESASSNRFTCMKILVDIANVLIANPSADVSTLETSLASNNCEGAAIIKLPYGNALLYEASDLTATGLNARYGTFIYGYQNTVSGKIASCTKVLTAMTVLDYVSDLNALITLTANDVAGQSNGTDATPVLAEGEKFTVRDLLYAMMMPSSNRAAQALARYTGNIILNAKEVEVINLPSEYQRVEYIESTGNQYIDTGYTPTINTELGGTFKTNYTSPWPSQSPTPYGIKDDSSNNWIGLYMYTDDGSGYFSAFGSQHDKRTDFNGNTALALWKHDKTGVYVNGTQKTSYSNTSFPTTSLHLYLFCRNGNGTAERFCKTRMQEFTIRENDTTIARFIPCYRKADNEIGMYDVVRETFYTNSGSGTFTKGGDL